MATLKTFIMNENFIITKTTNILGNITTVISIIFLVIFGLSGTYGLIKELPNIFAIGDLPAQIGAIIGLIFGVSILVFFTYKFSRLHNNLKSYLAGIISRKTYLINYYLCCFIAFLLVFIPILSRSTAVIILFWIFISIPIIYLFSIHKYSKKGNES